MKRKTEENEPEPRGGRAAKRLQEFMDQRLPSEKPPAEGTQEESQSNQQEGLHDLARKLQELVEHQKQLEIRVSQLEQRLQRGRGTPKSK